MRTTLKQINEGFELEIPHEFFESLKLRIGDEVDVRVKDNSIIVKPVNSVVSLEELIEIVTPENTHPLI
jgi:antitoxin component of MazEF toxin-antitoxin module